MKKLLYSFAAIICLLNGISSSPYKDYIQIQQNNDGDGVEAKKAQTNIFPVPPYCGIANSPNATSSRIYGGTPAKRNEFPWMVFLSVGCSGSFINSRWILTAAHCFFVDGRFISSTKIYAKALVCNGYCDSNSIVFASERVIVHKQYDHKQNYNDIALIRLGQNVRFDNEISPICLPIYGEASGYNLDNRRATVSGWGYTLGNDDNDRYFKTQLDIWPAKQCEAYGYQNFTIKSQYSICAKGSKRGSSACNGDSGSPLMLQFPADDSEKDSSTNIPYYAVGIVSFSKKPCAEGKIDPDVLTNVTTYIPWIRETILNNQ